MLTTIVLTRFKLISYPLLYTNLMKVKDTYRYSSIQKSHVFNFKFQFSTVAQSCLTLCDPLDCSTAGFPVHHQLPELVQTHGHRVSDAIQPSHPLLSPFPLALNLSQHQGLFQWVLHIRWPKYWIFSFSISPSNEFSGLISFRVDWLDLLAVQGTQEPSPTLPFKSINSLMFSFLYSPTLTSIQDYWKNNSFD